MQAQLRGSSDWGLIALGVLSGPLPLVPARKHVAVQVWDQPGVAGTCAWGQSRHADHMVQRIIGLCMGISCLGVQITWRGKVLRRPEWLK